MDPTCLWSSCLHSMAELAEPAWFPYLIYWAVWEEAVEGSWESVNVGEAWLSRNSCPALSSGALQRLLQGGCSRLLYMCICACVWYFLPPATLFITAALGNETWTKWCLFQTSWLKQLFIVQPPPHNRWIHAEHRAVECPWVWLRSRKKQTIKEQQSFFWDYSRA